MTREGAALVGTFGPRSADEMVRVLAAPEAARCRLVELRLDLVPDAADHVARLLAASPVPVVATCRRRAEGGGFGGDEAARLDVLAAAARAGAAWIDVECDVPQTALGAFGDARLLRSAHVARVPPDAAALAALAERLLAPPAHAGKLVAHEGDARDTVRLLEVIAAQRGRLAGHVVSQPFSRLASAVLGAPFVYAALRPGGRIGLPLPTVPALLDRADLGRVGPGTRAWVLLGRDVEASVSPEMLNAAFRAAGEDVVALRWSTDDPRTALSAIAAFSWAGAAVTIPHKGVVHDLLAERGAALGVDATASGAVNTVLVRGGDAVGENTDAGGLLDALAPAFADGIAGGDAGGIADGATEGTGLVLGAGGAARAAVLALRRLGVRVRVWARRPDAARALQALGAVAASDVAAALRDGPVVVVDATPAGAPGAAPVVDLSPLPRRTVVMDMLVAPRPTALLADARAGGHRTVTGLSMLAHQAARQVELLTGKRPDAAAMQALGEELLAARARRVVLLGLRCSGKSVVGRRVAELLSRPFVDTDAAVAAAVGRTPDELIRGGGEAAFRAAERDVLMRVAGQSSVVVATGGGAALAGAAFDALVADAYVVLLDAADDVLLRRLAAAPRAALTALPAAEELARQREERMPLYEERSNRVERTEVRGSDEVAESIAAFVVRETTAPARAWSVPS